MRILAILRPRLLTSPRKMLIFINRTVEIFMKKMFSVLLFPGVVWACCALDPRYENLVEVCAGVLNKVGDCQPVYVGTYDDVVTPQTIVHDVVYRRPDGAYSQSPPQQRDAFVHFIRTDCDRPVANQFVQSLYPVAMWMNYNGTQGQLAKVDCYTASGAQFQKDAELVTDYDAQTCFAPGEMGPAMLIVQENNTAPQANYDQSVFLHPGWNLVSWYLSIPDPDQQPPFDLTVDEVVSYTPNISSYFLTTPIVNEIFWYNEINNYYPLDLTHAWDLNHAYYILFNQSLPWQKVNTPQLTMLPFDITPDAAWTLDENVGEPGALGWFFIGYSPPGYTKLSTEYVHWDIHTGPGSGAQANRIFRGPFHWLYWNESTGGSSHYGSTPGTQYLVVVKTDDGKIYLPFDPYNPHYPTNKGHEWDEIGVLTPGRGYFLGFKNATGMNDGMEDFEWTDYPGWPQSLPPGPMEPQRGTASAGHFQFKALTHFFYAIFIDTVALEGDTIEIGDEIGVFTPEGLCVGATSYNGEYPIRLSAWKDDIATPENVDGYTPNTEITFVLYDQSANQEIAFVPPPGTMALQDDPIAPTHSGFGAGFYAWRSLSYGVQSSLQLPTQYGLGQNFPNPFNNETVIPLELPQRSRIRVELFNIRGQSLGIVHDAVEEAGWPRIRLNASGLSSGVYICRVTGNGLERGGQFSDVSKIIVLK